MRSQLLLIALLYTTQAINIGKAKKEEPAKEEEKKGKEKDCQEYVDDITVCKHDKNPLEIKIIPPWTKPKPVKTVDAKDEKKEGKKKDEKKKEEAKEVKKPEGGSDTKKDGSGVPELDTKEAVKKKP